MLVFLEFDYLSFMILCFLRDYRNNVVGSAISGLAPSAVSCFGGQFVCGQFVPGQFTGVSLTPFLCS